MTSFSQRYRRFVARVLAHHANLHDVVFVGSPAENRIEGWGIWENAEQAAKSLVRPRRPGWFKQQGVIPPRAWLQCSRGPSGGGAMKQGDEAGCKKHMEIRAGFSHTEDAPRQIPSKFITSTISGA